jgi:hypothetical protein
VKIAFDIGGVLSKYPGQFRQLMRALIQAGHSVHIITDMPLDDARQVLRDNGFDFIPPENIHAADYSRYGENCKAALLKELGIEMHFDDHIGYIAEAPAIGLLVMPRPNRPYNSPEWVV